LAEEVRDSSTISNDRAYTDGRSEENECGYCKPELMDRICT